MNDKDIDDLSSLFLPDLHHNNDMSIKQEFAIDDFDELKQSSFVNFNNFLSNNQFISYKPDELNFPSLPQQHAQQQFEQSPQVSQYQSQSQTPGQQQPQQQTPQAPIQPYPELSYGQHQHGQHGQFGQHDQHGQHGSLPFLNHHHYDSFIPDAARQPNGSNPHLTFPQRTATADWLNQDHVLQNYVPTNGSLVANTNAESTAKTAKKKKAKPRRKTKNNDFIINYNTNKLKRLLDLKRVAQTNNFTIVDKNNNPIKVGFTGFLNGKFLTNDSDNCTYILTKHSNEENKSSKMSLKQDPQVILCYRRNYIQISMNMNISGLRSNNNKILRLQTSEYGYTITRVIKYFKLEIMAKTKTKKSDVPIFIKALASKRDTSVSGPMANVSGTKDRTSSVIDDNIIFSQIVKPEHIILLNNDETVEQGAINKYFLIKKLQFKNATPNNGSLTFQNYYHLIVKLLAVVADLYYDDYVDEEFNNGLNGANSDNNEVVLAELTSDPIIVRGRNPNFYTERNDILIKGRPNISKRSFQAASQENDDDAAEDFADLYNEEIIDGDDEDEGENTASKNSEDTIAEKKSRGLNNNNSDEGDDGDDGEEGDDMAAFEDEEQEHEQEHDQENNAEIEEEEEENSDNSVTCHNQESPLDYEQDLTGSSKYKYFPISKVYYLPPINVVYFPHGAHHEAKDVSNNVDDDLDEQLPESKKRRKSSNVYFK